LDRATDKTLAEVVFSCARKLDGEWLQCGKPSAGKMRDWFRPPVAVCLPVAATLAVGSYLLLPVLRSPTKCPRARATYTADIGGRERAGGVLGEVRGRVKRERKCQPVGNGDAKKIDRTRNRSVHCGYGQRGMRACGRTRQSFTHHAHYRTGRPLLTGTYIHI